MDEEIGKVFTAWNSVHLALKNVNAEDSDLMSKTEFKESVRILLANGLGYRIVEWYLEILKQDLQETAVPAFWKCVSDSDEADSLVFYTALTDLIANVERHYPGLKVVQRIQEFSKAKTNPIQYPEVNLFNAAKFHLRAVMFSQKPLNFEQIIQRFYTAAFHAFVKYEEQAQNIGSSTEEYICCTACNKLVDSCRCQKILAAFEYVNLKLNELGLLEQLAGGIIMQIIHEHIETHVRLTCKGNYEVSYISPLIQWLDAIVMKWLLKVYGLEESLINAGSDSLSKKTVEKLKGKLHHILYSTYAKIRMDQLFNIIIEFPESQPALEDLRDCLDRTDLRPKLIQSLKVALETRLLHPGVNTGDILIAYVSAIKALRVLDRTGVILELVSDPVRKYLRTRQDTVREIISNLIDSTSELSDELLKDEPLVLDESYNSDEEAENWENWLPDPVDADPGKPSKSRRSSDIISMLVNIYGSKELFINEYRTLLADRILSLFNYDTAREIRYLELLKLKFGETHMLYCEVMLKDVADSKRINSHIHSDDMRMYEPKDFPVNAMILSAQFWPPFREEKLELPPQIKSALEAYTRAFETLKGNRTLCWKQHLGLVDLQIELKDRVLNLSVSPIHATIIMHFETKARWTIEELSGIMHVPASALQRKITYWQSQGIIQEEGKDTYVLVEEQNVSGPEIVMIEEEEEVESAMASSHDQREEELQVFWSYIVGMLTNLESLPLERIHTMLKMFAMQGPTAVECSILELRHFLDRKVREQKLLFSGGLYRLTRHNS